MQFHEILSESRECCTVSRPRTGHEYSNNAGLREYSFFRGKIRGWPPCPISSCRCHALRMCVAALRLPPGGLAAPLYRTAYGPRQRPGAHPTIDRSKQGPVAICCPPTSHRPHHQLVEALARFLGEI